jgi:hypothetical protein
MGPEQERVRQLINDWFIAFQGSNPAALLQLITIPFVFSKEANLRVLSSELEFSDWWKDYVAKVRAATKVARGEIMKLRIDPISTTAALARLQSARLDEHDNVITIVTTAFIAYQIDNTWKVGASVADAVMNSDTM